MKRAPARGVLGIFAHADAVRVAITELHAKGLPIADVYAPVQDPELLSLADLRPSPVRYFTFAGGVAGLVTGFGLALLSSAVWGIVVGGKPLYSIVPFMVVGFELAILLGALSTALGLLLFARLPYRAFPSPAYRPAFSVDRFGVWVDCAAEHEAEARALLQTAGAVAIEAVREPEVGQ